MSSELLKRVPPSVRERVTARRMEHAREFGGALSASPRMSA